MELTSIRRLHVDVPRNEVWQAMCRVDGFSQLWPWLRRFDGTSLSAGSVWHCAVQPPLPYGVRFTIALVDVVEPQLVTARVNGDVSGTARLALEEEPGGGCAVVMESVLRPEHPLLRVVARVAPQVARVGHDWVLDTGARQFVERAL